MIISASRRTDLPAFYVPWFMNRVAAGYCTVPNPMNAKQVSTISLRPADVDAIVFWTRDPKPLMPYLDKLNSLGLDRYYFQFTITGYHRNVDQHGPPVVRQARTFKELAFRIGPERVIWRYDPIQFSGYYSPEWHIRNFRYLAGSLQGHTRTCKISIVQGYKKTVTRFESPALPDNEILDLVKTLSQTAAEYGIAVEACATELNTQLAGVAPGRCIDGRVLRGMGVNVAARAAVGQRKLCKCIASRDIGMYESCQHGCTYCYATSRFDQAAENFKRHDPSSPSMLGNYIPASPLPTRRQQLLTLL